MQGKRHERHERCYVGSVNRERVVKPQALKSHFNAARLSAQVVQRTTAPVQPISVKQSAVAEKADTTINVCMPREMRERIEAVRDRRLVAKGHRLSLSDLAREAFFLLLEREEANQPAVNS